MMVDSPPSGKEKYPANQPRGSIDQIDDDNLETDQVSGGPLLNRLLSLMRFESRPTPADEAERPNGILSGESRYATGGFTNGDFGGDHSTEPNDGRLPSATSFPEATLSSWKVPTAKLDFSQTDERLKLELQHIGFLPADQDLDYDAHTDDEAAQRLRFLQKQLREQMIINGARKARLLQIAQERMAYQEYSTILEDLDTQVQQAYLKRNRTLGKGKKTKRPGGASGATHAVAGSSTAGTAKPGIGDVAKTLMERRKKWIDTITPVFSDDVTRVRTEEDDIFGDAEMAPLIAAEREREDEEQE
jgi:transcriptional adapter 3